MSSVPSSLTVYVPKSIATVVCSLTSASSPLVTTSVDTTSVCETDWMSEVLPAA